MKRSFIGGAGVLALSAGPLFGGALDLDRGVLSAGGGAAASSRFAVIGTIGQPVAHTAPATVGTLAARAGFWSQALRWLNAPPVAANDTVARRAGQGAHVLASQLLANDADGDLDTLQLLSVAATSAGGGTVLRDGPWVIYLPPISGGPPTDSFTYQVSDGSGGTAAGTVIVQVALPPDTSAGPLAIRSLAGPPVQVEVRFQGIAGRSYRVQTASAVTGPWADSGTIAADGVGVLVFLETLQPDPRFFRILEP
jgi:hypothetical protein